MTDYHYQISTPSDLSRKFQLQPILHMRWIKWQLLLLLLPRMQKSKSPSAYSTMESCICRKMQLWAPLYTYSRQDKVFNWFFSFAICIPIDNEFLVKFHSIIWSDWESLFEWWGTNSWLLRSHHTLLYLLSITINMIT